VTLGRKKRGRIDGDPLGSERGRSVSQRKSGRDPGFTPTEQRKKNELMKQFQRNSEGGGVGNSAAYRASPLWCSHPGCYRPNGTHSHRRAA